MANPTLITLNDSRSAAAEAYRTLRTNLMFMSVERPVSTILVTAVNDSEDKSLVAANLAVAFAQAGNNTILIDADMRRPTQHTLWGLENKHGLTTMFSEDSALSSPPLQPTSVPNLSLLASGALPPVPSDLLSNQRLNQIIGVLKARAHYLIFDSPPALAATDAALLGVKLDGALLVVRAGSTRRDHTQRAQLALERVHVRLLGVVLTNAPRENTGNYA
ncbi:MAG: CpsD/CapB family tyrosine-protein kinase [Chloroflexota bacterium]|nr:CpsD/CapB family tyrosine-protein kinase [Chloroflexota bacterium]